jgi:ATP-dependent Clp protease ATP-binding subunit ClpC
MPTHRYPVLMCRDAAGGWSAVAVDDGHVGFGTSAGDAKDDLKNHLRWLAKKQPYRDGPDFQEPELRWFTVPVRPEYSTPQRRHPSENTVPLAVPCVVGVRASGQPAAELPLLEVRFDYPNATQLKELVLRYAAQKLEGLTPEQLARCFPPVHVELDELAVPVRLSDSKQEHIAPPPPTLARVAEAVGDRAVRKGYARAWGREAELQSLVRKLHLEKANVLLVGESGVGKTTLLVDAVKEAEKLAAAEDDGPKQRRFWLTSAGRLVAGMKYLGQWEERVEDVIGELGGFGGVLCVERLLDLIRRGGTGPADSIAAFLVPYLARGEVRLVAEATPQELDACRRLMPGLPDLFQIVPVHPFDRATALNVIDKQLEVSASAPGLVIEPGSGERIVRLFRRFMPYSPFPGPASGFAREIVENHVRHGKKPVNPAAIVDRFRRRTGLPELFLRDELTLDRDDVLNWFRERVIDQPEACEAAANAVLTVKAGLNDPNRPPAVMLFCGPTGVGKTHMAHALATYCFGHGDDKKPAERLIRLDMSEFGGFDGVFRLLGPPNGEPGELIRRIRKQPFSVLLLDEIEKASAEVFDALMGVFDEGRLTDQYGRTTNFKSAIIVMTSNLGAGDARAVGFSGNEAGVPYRDAALRFFRPEFFNRMDAVVTFRPLQPQAVRSIARRELNAIADREGIRRTGLKLSWNEALVDRIVGIGFDARYGARPMQRAIEREVTAPLAKWLLNNSAPDEAKVNVDWADGKCEFRMVRRSES